MRTSAGVVLGLLALVSFAACGESSSSNDGGGNDGGAGMPGGGSVCATDEDCLPDKPKCGQSGTCMVELACERDADCRGELKHCLAGACQLCATNDHCSGETPLCAPSWEYGPYCAECVGTDSSTCPDGEWCVSQMTGHYGGYCSPPDCAGAPHGRACIGCINGSSAPCLEDGGDCEGAHAALDLCYSLEVTDGNACPSDILPTVAGCTPPACFDEFEAFEACLRACGAVTAACGT